MRRPCIRRAAKVLFLSATSIMVFANAAFAGTIGLVGGGAYGESVRLAGVSSGPLPSVSLPGTGGGPFTDSVASVNVPNVLNAGIMTVSTEGAIGPTGFVRSSSDVANANLLNGTVTADAAHSACAIDSAGTPSGSSSLVNLGVQGAPPVTVSPPPNTSVPIPGVGVLTLNEQTTTFGPGGNRSISVNAIHLHLTGLLPGDIIVGHSDCSARI